MNRAWGFLKGNYYITGASGTGKSTVARVLRGLGIDAVDLDQVPGLSYWRDSDWNRVQPPPTNRIDKDFIKQNKYQFDVDLIREMVRSNQDGLKFYCGSASNQRTFLKQFDMAFVLHCGGGEVKRRLAERPDQFGKNPALRRWLGTSNQDYVRRLRRAGAVVVNAKLAVEDVVAEIFLRILRHATEPADGSGPGKAVSDIHRAGLKAEVGEILLGLYLGGDRKLCYVLEPDRAAQDWQADLRAKGYLVVDTRRPDPDIGEGNARIVATDDFRTFFSKPRTDRSSRADAMKLLDLVRNAGPGPLFFVDDSRNLDRFRHCMSELFVLMTGEMASGRRALLERALLDGGYPIDASLPAAAVVSDLIGVASRPGPGHLGLPRQAFVA